MNETSYKIGIIDDDETKITPIITGLIKGCKNENGDIKNEKYNNYILKPVEIKLFSDIQGIVENVVDNRLDAIIIDYELRSYSKVDFTGVQLANALEERLYGFPVFILTSYEEQLFSQELFNSYQVFDYDRYLNEESERIELNYKIIEQVNKYYKEKQKWEEELLLLLDKADENVAVDERIIELDKRLEKSIDGQSLIPTKLKRELTSDKVSELIEQIDKIMKSE